MADKPTRRGWLKGLLGALFGARAADAVAEPAPPAGPPPAPAPVTRPFDYFPYPLGRVTTVVYDCVGGLTGMADTPPTTSFVYDSLGRLHGPSEPTSPS